MENPVQIKVYDDPSNFYAEVISALNEERAMNNLLIGLGLQFASGDSAGCHYQAAAFRNGHCVGVCMLSSPSSGVANLIVSAAAEDVVRSHGQRFIEAQSQGDLVFTGVVGEVETVGRYERFFSEQGYRVTNEMGQGIYRCTSVAMPPHPERLIVRMATPSDRSQVSQWLAAFAHEAVPQDGEKDWDAIVDAKIAAGRQWVLEDTDQQELVSMASTSRATTSTICIGAVFTPKAKRGKGYGSLVTGFVSQFHLAEGKDEVQLYTDLANPTSNKIYQNIGYEFVGNSRHIILSPPINR